MYVRAIMEKIYIYADYSQSYTLHLTSYLPPTVGHLKCQISFSFRGGGGKGGGEGGGGWGVSLPLI